MIGGHPLALPPVNHTAPVQRRIRAVLDGHIVVDMTSALPVREWPDYPQYYIRVDDIDPAVLVDEQHEQKLSRGTARRCPAAALLIYGDDATVEGLAGRARPSTVAFSLGGELWPLPGMADHYATIPAYEFDSPLRG